MNDEKIRISPDRGYIFHGNNSDDVNKTTILSESRQVWMNVAVAVSGANKLLESDAIRLADKIADAYVDRYLNGRASGEKITGGYL